MGRPHENLDVWKESIEFVDEIYEITKKFPEAEKFGLISQLRRAAVSIPTNIAEGAAKQSSEEFLRFLHIASGSLSEVETLLIIANNQEYLSQDEYMSLREEFDRIGALLNGLIRKKKSEV